MMNGNEYKGTQRSRLGILDSGCCGMPSGLGYEQGQYDVSQACSVRVLFPAVRDTSADNRVGAPGSSCHQQIADFCDTRLDRHAAELLATAKQSYNDLANSLRVQD